MAATKGGKLSCGSKRPAAPTEVVKRSDDTRGFVVLPRRRGRTHLFTGYGRNRRLAKNYFENLGETLITFVTLAPIPLSLRWLARA